LRYSVGVFTDKTLLITGGTGSFGNAVMRRFLDSGVSEIRIFSRDEKKQDDMRQIYRSPKIKFYVGDVRDPSSLISAMHDVNYVFHAAALKQVPSCEFHPMEAVKTNILGTENVIDAAIAARVEKVVCLSTDKAVYPINAMGMSKALMEKVMVAKSRTLSDDQTILCGTRYGNVMATRGSVIPMMASQIKNGEAITITDPAMTRFIMSLDDAINLVLFAFNHASNGDIFVQKSPATTIETLAKAIRHICGRPEHPVKVIGTRHGEKLFEVLLSREEMASAQDCGNYFRLAPDLRDLNYEKFTESGEVKITESSEYTSHNTVRLSTSEVSALLQTLEIFQYK
jgi:UDP-N-acetylglucosamine 4,6-dehydratase/5-epimerase